MRTKNTPTKEKLTKKILVSLTEEEYDFVKTMSETYDITLPQCLRAYAFNYDITTGHLPDRMCIRNTDSITQQYKYYRVKHSGKVNENRKPIESVKNEKNNRYQQQRPTFYHEPHSHGNQSSQAPEQQDDYDEQWACDMNKIYLENLLQKGDLHIDDGFFMESTNNRRILGRRTIGQMKATDLTYFDRHTKVTY